MWMVQLQPICLIHVRHLRALIGGHVVPETDRSVGVNGRSPVSAGAQYGSNGPSRDKSGIGGTIDELGPGRGERGVDTGRCLFLPRVANRLAAEPAEVQAASGRQHHPASRCRGRGDYPRIPAPPVWESPKPRRDNGPSGR